jgi:hypothetical protein
LALKLGFDFATRGVEWIGRFDRQAHGSHHQRLEQRAIVAGTIAGFGRGIDRPLREARRAWVPARIQEFQPKEAGAGELQFALTREKIIAATSRVFVCIVDATKLAPTLGAFPLPVEVIPMARALVAGRLTAIGGRPVLRAGYITDNGNHILDVHDLLIKDPVALESALNQIPGVVTVGLFAQRPADVLLIGSDAGVRQI